MKMKTSLMLLCIFVSSVVFADSDRLRDERCLQTPQEEKYVAMLNGPDTNLVKICSLYHFSIEGDGCTSAYGGDYATWEDIVDLNKDMFLDLIVAFHGHTWEPTHPFFVLMNCGDNTYIKILEDSFDKLVADKSAKNGKWRNLVGRVQFEIPSQNNIESYNKKDIFLKFDLKQFKYINAGESKASISKGEDEDYTRSSGRLYEKYGIPWNQFPHSLPRPQVSTP
jgi:hypothetical protein